MEQLIPFLSASGILGILVLGIVQYLKVRFGLTAGRTKIVLVLISIILGCVYFFLTMKPEVLSSILIILSFAQSMYELFAKDAFSLQTAKK